MLMDQRIARATPVRHRVKHAFRARPLARPSRRIWVLDPIGAGRAHGDDRCMTDTGMKTVLAGVDGSEPSAHALALALALAPLLEAAPLAAWIHPYADWEAARHEGRSDDLADEIHHQ